MAELLHDAGHIVGHAALDTLKILPFLFLTYLIMEFLEHRAGERVERAIARAGKMGPVIGALLGLLPQCGFSAAAAGLFSGRVITVGTLLAVFLATSDEMIAVFLGAGLSLRTVLAVLAVKFAVAALGGFLADALFRGKQRDMQMEDLCQAEGCHCEKGILRSALHHALHITLFVLAVNLVLGALLHFVSAEQLAVWLAGVPVLGQAVAALVGLIPNCAASVAIATLYARGVLSAGAMLAGLLTGAGVGLLVLFRTNKRARENLIFTAVLLGIGIAVGCLLDYTGLAALLQL
ncbi:MAG: arsenic efflux protein [Clostridia bacterium]|nr:arsenic efflux protein [Clostridia bacterium]